MGAVIPVLKGLKRGAGEGDEEFSERGKQKLLEVSQFDDDTLLKFYNAMQPQVPAIPAGYFMNAAMIPAAAFADATAVHCAMAWATLAGEANDQIDSESLIDSGELKQGVEKVTILELAAGSIGDIES